LCPTGNSIGNNGQIQCTSDFVQPGRSSAYTYDLLGRLTTAKTTGSSSYPAWGLSFAYDRYGNLNAQSVTAGSGPNFSFTINPANNQITNYTYDAAGNVIVQPLTQSTTYTYDAEECNTSYSGIGGAATYTCDGNELRVKKAVTGSNAVTTVSVRSGGQVIAEYDNGAAVASPTREYLYGRRLLAIVTGSTAGAGGTIIYQHRDHLSPRLYTDVNGNDVGEQGTFPFGGAWYSNNTTSNWVFTTYERDTESTNDYALARSYADNVGRFLSTDPLEGHVGDPQSWNRYAYVENDPINLIDPSGQGFWQDLIGVIADLAHIFSGGA
jgi:RHS repeat-associated protein